MAGYPPGTKGRGCVTPGILNTVSCRGEDNYLDTLRYRSGTGQTAVSGPRFQQCFFENCRDKGSAFVRQIVG